MNDKAKCQSHSQTIFLISYLSLHVMLTVFGVAQCPISHI